MTSATIPSAVERTASTATTGPSFLRPTTLLIVYIGLLLVLPSRLVVPGLGAAGTPAQIWGLLLLILWGLTRLMPAALPRGWPARLTIVVFFVTGMTSYAAAWLRGVPTVEGHGADRYLIAVLSSAGVALTAMDAPATRAQLDRILMAACWFGGFMSVVGIGQYVTHKDLSTYIKVPGLKYNRELVGLSVRSVHAAFDRVAGTALHYIEFGAVVTLLLPIALHYAIHTPPGRKRNWRWALVAVFATAAPLSIARSATLGLVLGLFMLMSVWRPRFVAIGLFTSLLALTAMKFAFPGLLGTIRALFTYWNQDSSITARTTDYSTVGQYFSERPWFGRGGGTFIPGPYITLDNQYLGTLVAGGIVTLVGVIAVFLSPFLIGRHIRRYGTDAETRHLGQALAASGLITVVLSGTFDSLAFPTFTGLLFVIVGASGALWRLNLKEGQVSAAARDPQILREQRDYFRWVPKEIRREPRPVDPAPFVPGARAAHAAHRQ
ncbi:MAG: hypothetical protein QOG52_2007 [Frankiaceae bacterium]|nr:hypothetical protein [Frankiaceae bacterium]